MLYEYENTVDLSLLLTHLHCVSDFCSTCMKFFASVVNKLGANFSIYHILYKIEGVSDYMIINLSKIHQVRLGWWLGMCRRKGSF